MLSREILNFILTILVALLLILGGIFLIKEIISRFKEEKKVERTAEENDKFRLEDLKNIQKALEEYYLENKVYPQENSYGRCIENWPAFEKDLSKYISPLPKDPLWNKSCYWYISLDGKSYKLFTKMEADSEEAKNDGGLFDNIFELYSVTVGSSSLPYDISWLKEEIPSLSSWPYREKISFQNSKEISLSQAQTRVEILWQEKMREDFEDLRFTDKNHKEVYFYSEKIEPKNKAVFWIKGDFEPGENRYFFYFGNEKAKFSETEFFSFDKVFEKSQLGKKEEIDDDVDDKEDDKETGEDKTLIAEWLFEEGKGTRISDTRKIYNGYLKGSSLKFDGKDDYLETGHSESLNIDKDLSLELWVFPLGIGSGNGEIKEISSNQDLIWKEYYIDEWSGYSLSLEGGKIKFQIYTDKGGFTLKTEEKIEMEQWQQIVATYEEDQKKIKIYLNGKLLKEEEVEGKIRNNSFPLRIGRGKNYFKGITDEIRIYKRVLSEEEIKLRFQGFYENEENLILLYHLDEAQENIAKDDSPYKNNGELFQFDSLELFEGDHKESGWTNYNAPHWLLPYKTPSYQIFPQGFSEASGLVLNGRNYLDFSVSEMLYPIKDDFTFEIWIFPKKINKKQIIIEAEEGKKDRIRGFLLNLEDKGTLKFSAPTRAKGKWEEIETDKILVPQRWYFIVGTYSREYKSLNLYLDGELVASKDLERAVEINFRKNLLVGGRSFEQGREFNFEGGITYFRLYNRELGSEEIKTHFGFQKYPSL